MDSALTVIPMNWSSYSVCGQTPTIAFPARQSIKNAEISAFLLLDACALAMFIAISYLQVPWWFAAGNSGNALERWVSNCLLNIADAEADDKDGC